MEKIRAEEAALMAKMGGKKKKKKGKKGTKTQL
jgi:hypothetical protein